MLSISQNQAERCIRLGQYLLEHQTTVRATAEQFGISKSTVHKDVTHELKHIRPSLYTEVMKLMEKNRAERHIRGGEATRQKYLNKEKSV